MTNILKYTIGLPFVVFVSMFAFGLHLIGLMLVLPLCRDKEDACEVLDNAYHGVTDIWRPIK